MRFDWQLRNFQRKHQKPPEFLTIQVFILQILNEYGDNDPILLLWDEARQLCDEYKAFKPTPQNRGQPQIANWSYRLDKVNFDGAIFVDINASGIGVIVRDFEGFPIAALSRKGRRVGSAGEAELLAAQRALVFARCAWLRFVWRETPKNIISGKGTFRRPLGLGPYIGRAEADPLSFWFLQCQLGATPCQ